MRKIKIILFSLILTLTSCLSFVPFIGVSAQSINGSITSTSTQYGGMDLFFGTNTTSGQSGFLDRYALLRYYAELKDGKFSMFYLNMYNNSSSLFSSLNLKEKLYHQTALQPLESEHHKPMEIGYAEIKYMTSVPYTSAGSWGTQTLYIPFVFGCSASDVNDIDFNNVIAFKHIIDYRLGTPNVFSEYIRTAVNSSITNYSNLNISANILLWQLLSKDGKEVYDFVFYMPFYNVSTAQTTPMLDVVTNLYIGDDFYDVGLNEGFYAGLDAANGTVNPDSASYISGRDTGYNEGYSQGQLDANTYTFSNLIFSSVDAAIGFFTSIFNFEVLGVNLSSFLLSLLSISVVLFVVKFFLKGS